VVVGTKRGLGLVMEWLLGTQFVLHVGFHEDGGLN